MTDSLEPGLTHNVRYTVPESKLVPELYPNVAEYKEMPRVFATGFLVGLIELSCIRCVNPHINWPDELTVGTHIDVSHEAPTPPEMVVMASVELVDVHDRHLEFNVEVVDEVEVISQGKHERYIVDRDPFEKSASSKLDHRKHD